MKSILFIVVGMLFSACSSLQVQVDYDPKYDFKEYSKFSVVYNYNDGKKSLTGSRISNILAEHIEKRGYEKVMQSEADFYFTVLLNVQNKKEIETYYENMGFNSSMRPRPYIAPGGVVSPINRMGLRGGGYYEPDIRVSTNTYEYKEGKLVLEVVDVKQNAVVWQGVAEDELSENLSHEERTAYINKVITELLKDFPSK